MDLKTKRHLVQAWNQRRRH